MPKVKKVIAQANACLGEREDITSAPLWHMGKVALFKSKDSYNLLQNTVDYLTCKGQANKPFTDDEKEFMKELFEALWWGGEYKGYPEAAQLADHYVNGHGVLLELDEDVYKTSVIVSDAMRAMKDYIKDQVAKKKSINMVRTSDRGFLHSSFAASLSKGRRSTDKQGYILADGALLTEQSNQRLKNADNRFHLAVNTAKNGERYSSRWRVESIYDFEPFSKGYVTHIPLGEGFVLKLPDGLSNYLTKIGVAKEYTYYSEWHTVWE